MIMSGRGIYSAVGRVQRLFSGSRAEALLSESGIFRKISCFCLLMSRAGFFHAEVRIMEEKRIAVAAIVIDEQDAAVEVNSVLHEYNDMIIGRMGLPYKERGISLISVALDASPDRISSLTGRLGQINGVSVKAAISKK